MIKLWMIKWNDGDEDYVHLCMDAEEREQLYLKFMLKVAREEYQGADDPGMLWPSWMVTYLGPGSEDCDTSGITPGMALQLHDVARCREDAYWTHAYDEVTPERLLTFLTDNIDKLDSGFMTELIAVWKAKDA